MNLRNIIDNELLAQGLGRAQTEGVKKIVDKIFPIDLEFIMRSVEVSEDTIGRIAKIIREAVRKVKDEEGPRF
ncbi:hypothetical protein HZC21_00275 [Candidatus Peregrinibacteria bacterium]|nr:hypothetical protein [Candidatus Peregrinibacteria bacterium]